MSDRSWTRRIALTAAAGGFALALVAAPLAPGGEFPGFTPSAALAKGGGNNGAGNGGGNGRGHGKGGLGGSAPGQVISNSAVGGEDGPGHGHGLALGHDKDAVSGVLSSHNGSHMDNHGALTSMLGSLNAAHAIANGNTNTNPNSRVGQIREYMDAFNDYTADPSNTNLGIVAQALIDASNKDLEVMGANTVEDVVGGVNDLLGDNIDATDDALDNAEAAVAEEISPTP